MINLRLIDKDTVSYIEDWLNEDRTFRILARCSDRPFDLNDRETYVDRNNRLVFLIYSDSTPIGYCLIYQSEDIHEIGIAIASRSNRNKGIGVEVAKQLMKISTMLFGEPKKFRWATADYNIPSQHIAERLGFQLSEVLHRAIDIDGKKYNALVYEKENADDPATG